MLLLKQQLLEKLEKDLLLLLKRFEILQVEVQKLQKILNTIVEEATIKANEGKAIANEMIQGYKGLNDSINSNDKSNFRY